MYVDIFILFILAGNEDVKALVASVETETSLALNLKESVPKLVKIIQDLGRHLAHLSIDALGAFVAGIFYAISGILKPIIRGVLVSPPVRQRFLAAIELDILRDYDDDYDLIRLPVAYCAENKHITLDTLWDGGKRRT
jgi:hypothetical protein